MQPGMKAHQRRLVPLCAIAAIFLAIAFFQLYTMGLSTRDVQKAQMRVTPRTGTSFCAVDIKPDERIDCTYFLARYHHASKATTYIVEGKPEFTATIMDREATYDPRSQSVIGQKEIGSRRIQMLSDEVAGLDAFLGFLRSTQKEIERWDEEFVVLEFFKGGVRVGVEHLFVPTWARDWPSRYDLVPLHLHAKITEDQWRQIGAFRGIAARSADEDDSNSERSGSL
jgi:hypothetical protein